jgi:hypothetical protein
MASGLAAFFESVTAGPGKINAAKAAAAIDYFPLSPLLRGEGWGEGLLRQRKHRDLLMLPLTRR